MRPGYLGDVKHRKRGLRFEKKQLVEFLPRKKKVDFQSWARPDDFMRYGRRAFVGLRADDVKTVSIERLSLSPHVEKPLNSKRWIKVSYLNQFREFRVFRFPMSISHIRILWLCNTKLNVIARQEFELVYYNVAAQQVSHYTIGIPHQDFLWFYFLLNDKWWKKPKLVVWHHLGHFVENLGWRKHTITSNMWRGIYIYIYIYIYTIVVQKALCLT